MRTFRSLLLLALCAGPAFGQTTKHGSISAADSSCIERACTSLQLTNDVGTVTVQLSGTWSATLKPEKTVDGTNWVSAGADLTSNGITSYGLAAHTGFRVRASAYVSGVVQLDLKQSTTVESGATPGGSNQSFQINSSGALAGIGPTASAYAGWDSGGNAAAIVPGLEARTDATGSANLCNGQSGAPCSLQNDNAKQLNVSHASANAVAIAQAGTGGFFPAGYIACVKQTGTGAVTVTATTSTFDITGTTSFSFNRLNATACVRSNGTNYEVRFSPETVNTPTIVANSFINESKTDSTSSDQDYSSVYTIPASSLIAGTCYAANFGYLMTTGTSSGTLTHYIKLGSTKVFTTGAPNFADGQTNKGVANSIMICGTAAAGASVQVDVFPILSGALATANTGNETAPTSLATNGALTIVPGVTYSSTGSTETLVLRRAIVTKVAAP